MRLHPRSASGLVFAALVAAVLWSQLTAGHAQTADAFDPHPNDGVIALAVQPDGKTIIGGFFSYLGGQPHQGLARVNPDGSLDPSFPSVSWLVNAIAMQPDGKIIVGGVFGTVGTVSRNCIARILPNGVVDPEFQPVMDAGVSCLAIQPDGRILVGGFFSRVNGTPRSNIARLNPDGSLDTEFNPGAGDDVLSIALQPDGKILVGGWFRSLAGQPRNLLGRLNPNGTLDAAFDAGVVGGDFPSVSCVLVQPDGKIVFGGLFNTIAGVDRINIGRVNDDGSLDWSFVSYTDSEVLSLAQQADGKILVGGAFGYLSFQPRANLGRINPDGGLDTSFNAGISGQVSSIALQADGRIVIGGWVTSVGGQPRQCLGRLINNTLATQSLGKQGQNLNWLRGGSSPEVWRTTFEYSADGVNWTSLGVGTRIAGGWQVGAASLPAKPAFRARGFLQGGRYQGSGQIMETTSGALAISQQPLSRTNDAGTLATFNVLAGGGSSTITHQWRRAGTNLSDGGNISGATTPTLSLSNVFGADAGAYTVVVTSGTDTLTSQAAQLKVNDPMINTQPVSQWASNGQAVVFSVAATGSPTLGYQWRWDGTNLPGATASSLTLTNVQPASRGAYDVVVANTFGSVTSAPAYLGTTDPFNPQVNGSVHCLAVQRDGKVVIGGAFTQVGSLPRTNLARVNLDGSLDLGFPAMTDTEVYALAIQEDDRILVGGSFTKLAGQARNYFGRLNEDGSLDSSFIPMLDSHVLTLALQPDGMILAGGWFAELNGDASSRLGRLWPNGTRDVTFNPVPNYAVGCLALQGDGKIVIGGGFSTVNGQNRNRVARLNADGSLDTTFIDPQAWNGVNSIVVQPDGKLLLGGSLDNFGGVPRYYVARLNSNGALDLDWNANVIGGPVYSIGLQADGRAVLGGTFYQTGGQTRNNLARVWDNSTVDASFDPGANGLVECLAVLTNGQVMAGGGFTTLGKENRTRLGRLNSTHPAVESLAYTGSTVTWLRAGSLTEATSTRFSASTNGVSWFDLGPGVRVAGGWQRTGVSLPAGATIRGRGMPAADSHAGNWFFETVMGPPVIETQPVSRTNNALTVATLAAKAVGQPPLTYQWRKDGTNLIDSGTITGSGSLLLTLTNVLYPDAGGYSLVVSNTFGSVTSLVARLEVRDPVITQQPVSQSTQPGQNITFSLTAAGSLPLAYQWRHNGSPVGWATNASMTLSNVQPANAGEYTAVVTNLYGAVTSTVAILHVNLAVADNFNPGANNYVHALAVQPDGAIMVGGRFTNLAGQAQSRIGRLRPDGTLDTSFFTSANDTVWSVGIQNDTRVLAGGDFTEFSGQPTRRLGRLNLGGGGADGGFNPWPNGTARCVAVQPDDMILVGGSFDYISFNTRPYLARLQSSSLLDATFTPALNGPVYSIAQQPDGKILVGGSFSTVNALPCKGLVRLHADGTVDTNFNASLGPTNSGTVYALLMQKDGRVIVGGQYTSINGQERTNLARLNPDGSIDDTFGGTMDGAVLALCLQADGKLVLGGTFGNVFGQARAGIARLHADGTLDPDYFPGEGWTWIYSLALQPDGKLVTGGWFGTMGGQARNGIARLNAVEPAIDHLAFTPAAITWQRGGSTPEVWRTAFDFSTNGVNWTTLGSGTRTADGWEVTGLSLPPSAMVRARGFVCGGTWFAETLAGPPLLISQPESATVTATANAGFGVSGVSGLPFSCFWLRNGLPLSDGGNVLGSQGTYLLLTNVLGADSGQYQAVLSNYWGSVTSSVAVLTVIDPAITSQPVGQSISAGQGVSFSFGAVGTPPLSYQWRLNGAPVSDATNTTLVITNAQAVDAGAYTAVVSNQWGAVTSTVAMLTVNLSFPDAYNPGTRSTVSQLMLQPEGRLLVSSSFGPPNQPRPLARFNPDGSMDPDFLITNVVVDISGTFAMALQPDFQILVSGISRQSASLWRLNRNGSTDGSFSGSNGVTGTVYGIALQPGGQLWAGGGFSYLKPSVLTNVALLQPSGLVDTNVLAGINGVVYGLAQQPDGKLLAGGTFTLVNGQIVSRLARLNPNGTADSGFAASANNTVFCVLPQPDGKILVAGVFTTLNGTNVNRLGRLNADGTLDASFNPNVNNTVYSVVLQTDGKIVVGGTFTAVSGQPRNRLARINPDGSLDPTFNPSVNGTVYALALQPNGALMVGGSFTQVGGQYRTNLARLAPTGPAFQTLNYSGTELTWERGGTAPEVWRTTFEVSTNGSAWTSLGAGERIGGSWRLGGVTIPAGASVRARGFVHGGQNNASSWFVESSLGPALITSQPVGRTNLAGTNTVFWVFASGSSPLSYQWRKAGQPLADGGNLWGAATPSLTVSNLLGGDGGGYSVVVSNAGGSVTSSVANLVVIEPLITAQPVAGYTNVGQTVRFTVAALGTEPLSYQWRKNGAIMGAPNLATLTIPNAQTNDIASYSVVVSSSYGAVTSAAVALTLNLALPDALAPELNDEVRSLATQPDGSIYIGGNFNHLGAEWFWEFGRLNADGSRDTNFNGHVNSSTDTVAVEPDGNVLAGGWFTSANDWPHSKICRFYPDGSLDPAINPAIASSTLTPFVDSLVPQPDGKFLIGGWFTSLAGQTRNYVGRFNANGTLDGFNPGANTHVMMLALQPDGKVIAAGNFTTLGGQTRNRIGRLYPDGSLDTNFNPNANATVNSVVLQPDGKILVGGSFTSIAGASRTYLARLNPDGSIDPTLNVSLSGGVSCIALQTDGSMILAGVTAVAGQTRYGVARVSATGVLDAKWSPQIVGGVGGVAIQPDGKVLLCGSITSVCGEPRSRLARLEAVGAAEHTLVCDGTGVTWWRGGTSPEVTGVQFQSSPDGTNWTTLGPGARISGGWRINTSGLSLNSFVRAYGFASGGRWNGSLSLIADVAAVSGETAPVILAHDGFFGFQAEGFGFNWQGVSGQVVAVDISSNLIDWLPLQTNMAGAGPLYFLDPSNTNTPSRFYRLRLP